ncbi:ATP-binding protein [Undibacterium sp. TJN25]|uniref:ATP-binding protein n=1 Tax=Undibacterium sp. TJN25 TaxID=3413056 RepID=UPI003BF41154
MPMTTAPATPSDSVSFGPFQLFPSERKLERDGASVDIGSRALDILIALLESAGRNVSNRELVARVWRDMVVEDSSLRVNIAMLRRILGDGRDGTRYIANIPGQGYCFVATVARAQGSATAGDDSSNGGNGGNGSIRQPAAFPLPQQLQRMVGRDEQVAALAQQVMTQRCVSIVGPGGMGKTTVAIAVAHTLRPDFDGQVCFFDLGALATPHLLASTMASTLALIMTSADPLQDLLTWLADRKILLVLDNCEHLVEVVASFTERLLQMAPQACILATSREPLRAEGEHVHRLAPLDSPPETPALSAEHAIAFPAVQLFVDRATANGAGFELSDADAPLVAEICRKLDGIALAIELGAGRVAAFGVRGTAELLDNRFRLSWHGRRTALPRHQTLSAMLDWSYTLLPEAERKVLRRLSTFVGHFSLEAASRIVTDTDTDDMAVAAAIDSLVAKSLASAETGAAGPGYRLLESARIYAAEKLRLSGETDSIARRHAIWLTARYTQAQAIAALRPAHGLKPAYIEDLGNLRAALAWSAAPSGDHALGIRLCVAVTPVFLAGSLLEECRRWSETGLMLLAGDVADDPAAEMALLETLAIASMFTLGNSDAVQTAIERGLLLAAQLGDADYSLRLLAGLNIFQTRIGDFAGALMVGQRSTAAAAALDTPVAQAISDWMLGVGFHLVGDQIRSQQYCRAGLARIAVESGHGIMYFGYDHRIRALVALARGLWITGSTDQAVNVAWQAINDAEQLRHPISMCIALIYGAPIFTWNGAWDVAAVLIERLIAHAEQHMLGPYHAVGKCLKGELLVNRGEAAAGIVLLEECLATLHSERHQVLTTVYRCALAQGLVAVGRLDEATAQINRAATGRTDLFDAAEIFRIQAEVQARVPGAGPAQAEQALRRALDCARSQSALSWELRAATSLCRLLGAHGRQDEGRRLLHEVLGRFDEGFQTLDHIAARDLLACQQQG